MANYVERMIGAATFNIPIIEEIEADVDGTVPALGVVVLAGVAAGLGGLNEGVSGVFLRLVVTLFGWVFWAFLVWIIGTKILPMAQTKSDMGELLRTMGFAQSPGIFRVLTLIPVLGVVIDIVIGLWLLATVVVAMRQALDYTSTFRAIVVCVIGWAVNAGIFYLLIR
jgi:hypothetical protein